MTHAISSTCGITVVVIALLKVIQSLLLSVCAIANASETADLSVSGDALTGGEGDVSGRAVAFAKATLNAAVDDG